MMDFIVQFLSPFFAFLTAMLIAVTFWQMKAREGANKSYGTRAFTGNPLILND